MSGRSKGSLSQRRSEGAKRVRGPGKGTDGEETEKQIGRNEWQDPNGDCWVCVLSGWQQTVGGGGRRWDSGQGDNE